MKKLKYMIILCVIMATILSFNSFANEYYEREQFIGELEQALEDSEVLNSDDYSIKELSESMDVSVDLTSVDEIISYLEEVEKEQKEYQEYFIVDMPKDVYSPLSTKSSASGIRTYIPKYKRSGPASTYILRANVRVNTRTGEIIKISSPRFTKSGGLGTYIENRVFNTENNGDSAYIECHYDWGVEIKIPGVTDVEITRTGYHTYMNYRYNEVYDCGNEEDI